MGLINALSVPIMFLNMFGGIAAGIWLIILGKWSAVGIAVVSALISSFLIGIAMMPSMLLSVPGLNMLKKGNSILGHFLLFGASIYTFGLLWYWSMFVFGIFSSYIGAKGAGSIPLLLMAYSVATAPVGYMAGKEQDSPASMLAAFCTMLGCMVFMFALMFGVHISTANLLFVVIMGIGVFVQLVITVQLATAMRISEEENYYKS